MFVLAHGLLSCVSAVFGVLVFLVFGGGVDNVQFAYMYLQALASFKLESSGSRQGRNFMWFPLRGGPLFFS